MLAWEPQDRPSATDALTDEIWKPIKDKKQEEKDSRKQKRKETLKGDGIDKRVRVLSHDVDEYQYDPNMKTARSSKHLGSIITSVLTSMYRF